VDKVVHLYNRDAEYEFPYRTYCGRIVSSDKGYQDITATDLEEEYTCKSCHSIKIGRVAGLWIK